MRAGFGVFQPSRVGRLLQETVSANEAASSSRSSRQEPAAANEASASSRPASRGSSTGADTPAATSGTLLPACVHRCHSNTEVIMHHTVEYDYFGAAHVIMSWTAISLLNVHTLTTAVALLFIGGVGQQLDMHEAPTNTYA